jgi:hypothetical protein
VTEVPLSVYASVTLDGSGNGTARTGPPAHGVLWRPAVASVRVSTGTLSPTCKLYVGPAATDQYFIDGTFTGNQNSTDAVKGQVLQLGDFVWAVWTGGDVGAQATVTVGGVKEIP